MINSFRNCFAASNYQQIDAGCADTTGSSLIATGRGGIPENSTQEVRSDRTWSDMRDISAFCSKKPVQAQIPQSKEILVQATSWHRNPKAKIEELVAVRDGSKLQVSTWTRSSNRIQASLICAAVLQS